MILLAIFCDDILRIIIALLDDEECIVLARTCKHLHKLVHCVRKTVTATDNIFEAVRSNLFISFTRAEAGDVDHLAINMRNITIDMLKYAYDQSCFDKYHNRDRIAYQLCKRGVLTRVNISSLRQSLIIHAITHGKRELLIYMNGLCDGHAYQQACSYGYAKIGDYDTFMKCNVQHRSDIKLVGYAIIGGNQDIIRITTANYRGGDDVFEQLATKIIKKDDHIKFEHEHISNELLSLYIIKYNALNIVRKCDIQSTICTHAPYARVAGRAVGMTLEMAELLLEVTNNDQRIVNLIISAYDYRLTEMLRAKGLYSKKLTARSSHTCFNSKNI